MRITGLAILFLLSVVSLYGTQGEQGIYIHHVYLLFRTINCMCVTTRVAKFGLLLRGESK